MMVLNFQWGDGGGEDGLEIEKHLREGLLCEV